MIDNCRSTRPHLLHRLPPPGWRGWDLLWRAGLCLPWGGVSLCWGGQPNPHKRLLPTSCKHPQTSWKSTWRPPHSWQWHVQPNEQSCQSIQIPQSPVSQGHQTYIFKKFELLCLPALRLGIFRGEDIFQQWYGYSSGHGGGGGIWLGWVTIFYSFKSQPSMISSKFDNLGPSVLVSNETKWTKNRT